MAPPAAHRNCARHVYMNWKKKNGGQVLKNMFCRVCRSTYKEEYLLAIEAMKKESVAAYQDYVNRDVPKFCKAFLPCNACSDMIDNNISETFNGYILNARGKHIIHMLEDIRMSLMVRQVKKVDEMRKITDILCPNIRKKIEFRRKISTRCYAYPAMGNKFEIQDEADKFVIDMVSKSCTCRVWQLTGIPCVHAISGIHFMNLDVANFVHDFYSMKIWELAYSFGLQPINGEKLWPVVDGFIVKPPSRRRMPGRPKKKRVRDPQEMDLKRPNRMKRICRTMTCGKCQQIGHNSRGCKNSIVSKQNEKRKRGRPTKHHGAQTSASTSLNPRSGVIEGASTQQSQIGDEF